MARYPVGTPYIGPTMNYDSQIDPDQLLRRLAYGRPAPLLARGQRVDPPFWGRLLDGLANSHAVLVRVVGTEQGAGYTARMLRAELPADRFAVGVHRDREMYGEDWHVIVYNLVKVTRPLPKRFGEQERAEWIPVSEVARVLKLTPRGARMVIRRCQVPYREVGAGGVLYIRQSDLAVLANRPGRWRKRKVKPADRIRTKVTS